MRSIFISLAVIVISSAAFAGSGSSEEVIAPTKGVSCTLLDQFSSLAASLNTKDDDYDVVKDVTVFDGVKNHKLFLAIFDNHDQTIDIKITLDGVNTSAYNVKIPKAGPSPFNPHDATKTMAASVFETSGLMLYCTSK